MNRLIIEYVFEGHKRGYNITSPTDDFDDATLKAVWRSAMPRGQGWGTDSYIGSRSIKCFPLPDDMLAVSEVTVTDLADEGGRRGIRRAVVDIMSPRVLAHHIESRLSGYPPEVQSRSDKLHRACAKRMPRLKKAQPLVLLADFTSRQGWWIFEALVLKLAIHPVGPLRRWETSISFTTLALDYRNESRIVALPGDQRQRTADINVLDLTVTI